MTAPHSPVARRRGCRSSGFCNTRIIVTVLVLSLVWANAPAAAQELHGTVRDSASRQPVPSAVLLLLDSPGISLGRTITDGRGEYRITTTPVLERMPIVRMRVVRIGFRPRELTLPSLDHGPVQLDIVMTAIPTMLEPVQVHAGAQCSRRDDRLAALSLLEQARAGLLATVVARETQPAEMARVNFRRRMDGVSDRIESQEVQISTRQGSQRAFESMRSAAEFVALGFMAADSDGARFFGPDAETLLDDAFRDGYCFQLRQADRDRPRQIGLAFAPARTARNRVDIDGTLWIDTAARQLKAIVYDYVGLDRTLSVVKPGGVIGFRELGNGTVVIDRWHFRLPAVTNAPPAQSRTFGAFARVQVYATESGGELVAASWPNGYTWRDTLGTLRLRATTSDGTPVPSMRIAFAGTNYSATTDSTGGATIRNVFPGPYTGRVVNPLLAAIGLSVESSVQMTVTRGDTISRILTIQTPRAYAAEQCRAAGGEIDTLANWFMARLEFPDGKPAAKIEWQAARFGVASWIDIRGANGTTSSDGLLVYCGGALRQDALVKLETRTAASEPWTPQSFIAGEPMKLLRYVLPAAQRP
jgi:hypothetical protein